MEEDRDGVYLDMKMVDIASARSEHCTIHDYGLLDLEVQPWE